MKTTLSVVVLLLFGILSVQAQDSVDVTFNVNMKVQAQKGNFTPATNTVTIPGGFNNWLNEPPANATKTMTDADADSIYTKVIRLKKGVVYQYKYNIGLGWDGKDESTGNRSVTGPTADSTVTQLFNNEAMPSGAAANVTFNVDMRSVAKADAAFATHEVYVAGSFTNWATGALQMSDANNDTIFTVTTPINSAQLIAYKFIHTADSALGRSWEGVSDRKHWVVDGAQTINKFWDDVDPNVSTADGNILFQIDMSVLEEIGVFDAAKDSARIYGSFNNWNAGGPANKWKMTQDFANPSLWTINVPFVQATIGGAYNFKYFVHLDDASKKVRWTDGWERPRSQGGGNRDFGFDGVSNQEEALVYYDDIDPDWVIASGVNLQAKFRVDMKPAMATAVGFAHGTDKVYWLPEMPSFVYTQRVSNIDWVDSDTMKVLELTDANNDSVYEGTLAIASPSFNAFEYRYAFVHNGAWTQEPGGFGDFAYRMRFIGQSAARTFPVNPWTMPKDTWSTLDVKVDQEVDPITSLTLVREENDLIVSSYQLHQNFPNPFNPSTTIKFDIAGNQHVTLKIFNLLGQEVATLVNEELKAGIYTAKFDGARLASGMYIYRITAGNYAEAKTMIMLK